MSRPEAKRVLGLTNCTIVKVAAAGIIRYVQWPERNLPIGVFFFLGEDVNEDQARVRKTRSAIDGILGTGRAHSTASCDEELFGP